MARSTTDTGCLGARFWGQVRGSSGLLKVLQGKGGTSGETSQIAGKARNQASFPGHIAARRILHGKEGVDGSSPSEGSKIPAKTRIFVVYVGIGEHLLRWEELDIRGRSECVRNSLNKPSWDLSAA
jgi:hypothetical protein